MMMSLKLCRCGVWLLGVVRVWLFVLEIKFRKLAPMFKSQRENVTYVRTIIYTYIAILD